MFAEAEAARTSLQARLQCRSVFASQELMDLINHPSTRGARRAIAYGLHYRTGVPEQRSFNPRWPS